MYYGFYLLAIALVVMIGQLAFALYQVASLLYLSCHEQGPPEFHLAPRSGAPASNGANYGDSALN